MKIWGHTFKTVENIKSVPKNTRDNKILASGGDDPTQMIQALCSAVCRKENQSQCQEQKINPSWRPTSALEMKTIWMMIVWCSHLVILADLEISQNFSWYNWRQCGMNVSSGCIIASNKHPKMSRLLNICVGVVTRRIIQSWCLGSSGYDQVPASISHRQANASLSECLPLDKPQKNPKNLGLGLKL